MSLFLTKSQFSIENYRISLLLVSLWRSALLVQFDVIKQEFFVSWVFAVFLKHDLCFKLKETGELLLRKE